MRTSVPAVVVAALSRIAAVAAAPGNCGEPATNRPGLRLEAPVMLMGDTMMFVLGRELEKAMVQAGVEPVMSSCSFGSGLARPSLFDCDAKIVELSATQRPRTVCVAVGVDDRQSIETERGIVPYGHAREWREAYAVLVGRAMDRLEGMGVSQIVWFLLPDMKERANQEHALLVNEIIAEQAACHTNTVVLFDLGLVLSRRPGTYTRYVMAADGRALTVRDPDGVHVSREGGKRVAETLLGLSETRPVRRSESRAEP